MHCTSVVIMCHPLLKSNFAQNQFARGAIISNENIKIHRVHQNRVNLYVISDEFLCSDPPCKLPNKNPRFKARQYCGQKVAAESFPSAHAERQTYLAILIFFKLQNETRVAIYRILTGNM